MPTKRCGASAVNPELTPECLIVTGGEGENGYTDVVEVLRENQWSTVQPLPYYMGHFLKSIVHNGNLYVVQEGFRDFHYCKVDTLLSSSSGESTVWRLLEGPDTQIFNFTSLGNQLLALGNTPRYYCMYQPTDTRIYTHSPHTQSWVAVQDIKSYSDCSASVTLPSGSIMALVRNDWKEYRLLEISPKGEVSIIVIVLSF